MRIDYFDSLSEEGNRYLLCVVKEFNFQVVNVVFKHIHTYMTNTNAFLFLEAINTEDCCTYYKFLVKNENASSDVFTINNKFYKTN